MQIGKLKKKLYAHVHLEPSNVHFVNELVTGDAKQVLLDFQPLYFDAVSEFPLIFGWFCFLGLCSANKRRRRMCTGHTKQSGKLFQLVFDRTVFTKTQKFPAQVLFQRILDLETKIAETYGNNTI